MTSGAEWQVAQVDIDAEERVASLRHVGPPPCAFTIRRPFDPQGRDRPAEPDPARMCPA
jgi:hypothetical protein